MPRVIDIKHTLIHFVVNRLICSGISWPFIGFNTLKEIKVIFGLIEKRTVRVRFIGKKIGLFQM